MSMKSLAALNLVRPTERLSLQPPQWAGWSLTRKWGRSSLYAGVTNPYLVPVPCPILSISPNSVNCVNSR